MKDVCDVRKICGRAVSVDVLMLRLEAGEQRVADSAGVEVPDGLGLIVEVIQNIMLLAKLAAAEDAAGDGASVSVPKDGEVAIHVGEAIVDRKRAVDGPDIGDCGARQTLIANAKGCGVFRSARDAGDGSCTEVDQAGWIGCGLQASAIADEGEEVMPYIPADDRAKLVVGAFEGAEAVLMLRKAIDTVVEAVNVRGSGKERASRIEIEGTTLKGAAVVKIGGGHEVNHVDGASGRSAAEEGRAGAFEHLNALDAVERMRNAVTLVPVGEAVVVDASLQATDLEAVAKAEAV